MKRVKENTLQHRECDIDYVIEEDEGKYYVQMWVTVNRQGREQKNKLGFNQEFQTQDDAEKAAIRSAKEFVDRNLSI